MNKNIIKNSYLFILMFILISFLSISYAVLNTELYIDGEASVRVAANIRITNIKMIEPSIESYETYKSEYSKSSTTIYATLENNTSEIIYEVNISNRSDNIYKVSNIIEDINTNSNVSCELINLDNNTIIEKRTDYIFKIKCKNTSNKEERITLKKTYKFEVLKKYIVKYIYELPKEYQAVEYIEANGTQWIDTEVPMNGGYTLYADGLMKSGKSGVLINGYKSNNVRQGMTFFANSNKYGYYWFGKEYAENTTLTALGISLKERFQFTQNKNGITLVQDDKSVSNNYSGNNTTDSQNIYIFNTFANANYKNGVLYEAIIINDNKIIKDFIPCYRVSDNIIGLYDLIEEHFYTNSGTGTFLKGKETNIGETMPLQEFTYGVSQKLAKNTFVKKGFTFVEWNTKEDGTGISYKDEQEVINLSSVNGDVIILYPQWEKI